MVFLICRKVALVIILTRAGLDLDPKALKSMKITLPKVGLIPWVVEATVVAVLTRYLLDLPWVWGFLLGSIIAAVSPAVVVPCLFRLRGKGYGVAKVRSKSNYIQYSTTTQQEITAVQPQTYISPLIRICLLCFSSLPLHLS